MANETIDGRLVRACALAYNVDAAGTGFVAGATTEQLIGAIGMDAATAIVRQRGYNAVFYADAGPDTGILAFRGTLPPGLAISAPNEFLDVVLDWHNDGHADPIQGKDLPGRVHSGFLGSLDALWSDIEAALPRFAQRTLYVTGHSKGGPLAQMAAYRLARANVKVAVRTFAGARAGDAAFAQAFGQVVPDALRFEYRDDLVPHLPPHTGAWVKIATGLRSLHALFPAQAPHPAHDIDTAVRFEALLNRLSVLDFDYVSAGALRFIDWSTPPTIRQDSLALAQERNLRLAEKIASFQLREIIGDHAVTGGYTAALPLPAPGQAPAMG